MSAFPGSYSQVVNINGETLPGLSSSYTDDGLELRNLTVATGVGDQLVDLAFTRADVSMIYFHSDQAVTLEFNDGAGTGGSITLAADFPWIWHTDKSDLTLNDVITADVTALYITNASGSTATIKIRVLHDTTP